MEFLFVKMRGDYLEANLSGGGDVGTLCLGERHDIIENQLDELTSTEDRDWEGLTGDAWIKADAWVARKRKLASRGTLKAKEY